MYCSACPRGPLNNLLAGSNEIPQSSPEQVIVGISRRSAPPSARCQRAELQAAAQSAQIGVAKAGLFPTFALVGNVGTLATDVGTNSLGDLFSRGSFLYSAGPSVQWNILNYGQISNNVRVQDAKFQQLLIDYQNTVLKAQQEVEDGIAAFIYSREQANFLRQSVGAAEGALRIAMLQYREGIADFTTVLTAEQNLYQAQNNLALATGSIALGLITTIPRIGRRMADSRRQRLYSCRNAAGDARADQLGHFADARVAQAPSAGTSLASGPRTASPIA